MKKEDVIEFVFPDEFVDAIYKLQDLGLDGGYGEYDLLVGIYLANELKLDPSGLGTDWDYDYNFGKKATVVIHK